MSRTILTQKPHIRRDVRARWNDGRFRRPTAKGHASEPAYKWMDIDGFQNLVLKGDSDDYYINVTNIKQVLADLRQYADSPIDSLPPNLRAEYDDVMNSLRMIRSTAVYPILYADVVDAFKDVQSVKPGTVGGYFVGCYLPSNYPGGHGCSDRCAGALLPPPGTEGFQTCQDAVVIYNAPGDYREMGKPVGAKHVVIFVQHNSNFTGFSNADVKHFRDAGFETATVLVTQDDNYHVIADHVAVDKLPREGTLNVNEALARQLNTNGTSTTTTDNSTAGLWWVFGFIVLAIVILLIALAVYSSRS